MTTNLIIKSATQTVDDFSLDCDSTWTVGYVKEKIEELYPNNPKKEHQKLIYGGKLLPNHLSIKSVLNYSQERHIFHLVCPTPLKDNASISQTKEAASSQSFRNPVPPANPAFPPVNQPILNAPSLSGVPGVTVAPLNTGDAFQQYLAMQQMYAQFMTQYLSQYNGVGVPPVIPYSPVITVPPVQTPQVPLPQQNVPQNPPRRQAEDENRDYLDYMYIISRAVMLFAVLYYYSSPSRILIVVSMFLFISIYVKLKRQNQQEMQRQANERQRNESDPTQQPPAASAQNSESEENVSNASVSDTESDVSLSQQSEGRSFISIVTTTAALISAFFSSLIPSDPVPVNVN